MKRAIEDERIGKLVDSSSVNTDSRWHDIGALVEHTHRERDEKSQ